MGLLQEAAWWFCLDGPVAGGSMVVLFGWAVTGGDSIVWHECVAEGNIFGFVAGSCCRILATSRRATNLLHEFIVVCGRDV